MTESNEAIKALIKAQTEMGKALKDTKNPFFKSKYADLTSVMAAVMPALSANGFAMIQPDGMDDRGVYVETIFMHESGEKFSTRIYLTIGKGDMQGYGSAQTYARRYGLMGLAGVAPEDDDGNHASEHPKQNGPSADEIKAAVSAIEKIESMDELQNHFGNLNRNFRAIAAHKGVIAAKDKMKAKLDAPRDGDGNADAIPY